MARTQWDPSYETGDPSRSICSTAKFVGNRRRAEAAEAHLHDSHDAIIHCLGRVIDFPLSHFLMEEELMVQVGSPSPPSTR